MARFICRFAVGRDRLRYSAVWRVWTARKQPDLYLAVRNLGGELKASVHAPRPTRPTWDRHFGFDKNAVSVVSKQAKLDGGPHKVRWPGYSIGPDTTVEYRIIIGGKSLEEHGEPVNDDVVLLPIPSLDEYLEVVTILGPTCATKGYPRAADAKTHLLSEGRLSDDRRVWIVYSIKPVEPGDEAPVEHRLNASNIDPNVDLTSANLRAVTIGVESNGSLELRDLKARWLPASLG